MTDRQIDPQQLANLIERARPIAVDYYRLTGRPLGITGEIGEYEATQLLEMTLAPVRAAGYDAVKLDGTRVQIKTRYLDEEDENNRRVPTIKMTHDWETVMLVLLDENFYARAIYEASRSAIENEITKIQSQSGQRGLRISLFKRISTQIWPQTHPS